MKVAMLGMVDGNGHPYSWSAMFNGYNYDEMEKCPFPVIPRYLEKEPKSSFGVYDAKVTHIWTDDPEDAKKVSKASLIPNIVKNPEDVIGEVDAVIVATDKGDEHIWRAEPFIKAGLPVFIDKPLADNIPDLKKIIEWKKNGAKIMSSSSLRFAKELIPYQLTTNELGNLKYINYMMNKSWERYGIHALEPVYSITGGGYESVQNTGDKDHNIIHLKHKDGFDVNLAVIYYLAGAQMTLVGDKDSANVKIQDSYYCFKKQLDLFIEYCKTGKEAIPFEDTVECMKIIIGGIQSRNEGGRKVMLSEYDEVK